MHAVPLRTRHERPRNRRAPEQRDELAPFQLIELHSVPCQPGPDYRISNWRGSVSGYQSDFATNRRLAKLPKPSQRAVSSFFGRRREEMNSVPAVKQMAHQGNGRTDHRPYRALLVGLETRPFTF